MPALARCLALALALPTAAGTTALVAQKPDTLSLKPDTTPHKASRLFRAKEPVVVWLQSDFKTVFKDRDTTSGNIKKHPAVLRFLNEKGDTVSFDVEIATHGNFRLARANGFGCGYPPLKVYFDKEKTKGSLFGGDGSLKLVTHCENGDRYAQNTLIEYAIYKMYNLLTPISLKARLANVNWVDPKNPKLNVTRPGIWIQDDEDLAKELRGKILMTQGASGTDMEPRQMAITDVFQYMIANTDFSVWALHNYRIVQTDTSTNYYPMAYDFDWSGLVDAPYARPDSRLSITRVTDRLYRGTACHPAELLGEVVKLFQARKDSLYSVLRAVSGLTPARLKSAEGFLDEFYKALNDPGTIRKVFQRPCNQ